MKQIVRYITLAAILGMAGTFIARGANDLSAEAQATIAKFQQADPGLTTLMNTSAGYAVFPGVGKGGLVIGGERGKGLVYERGVAIGEARLSAASIGAQIGGESFDEIILFETPAVLQEFKDGKYTPSAQVSGVVAATGASEHTKYVQGASVFVMPRAGLMGQAAVGGQKFTFKPFAAQQ